MTHKEKHISDFKIAGINYKKTDAQIRGQFSVGPDQYKQVLQQATEHSFFILSTCNRTEIYGMAEDASELIDILCSVTEGDAEHFSEIAYVKSGQKAVAHLFEVGAGLDSQILGDYEILGQIKTAAKIAKEYGNISPFLERLVNAVIQSSKAVKTHTEISGGTVSVSFAAVQYIKEHFEDTGNKKILLFGTGKIGRNTCKNLVDYLGTKNITLINRTEEKATALATELGLKYAPIEQLDDELAKVDIIFVATNSQEPTILGKQLEGQGDKLIIDMSVPFNVEKAAQQLNNVHYVNVDELSKIKDETLQKRKEELPKALAIVQEHIAEFNEWYEMRKHVPLLREVKDKLQELHTNHATNGGSEEKIQKVINTLAVKVRRQNTAGCHFIEAINEFIA